MGRGKKKNSPKTPRPEAHEKDLIPNALIFMRPNWRMISRSIRAYKDSSAHPSTNFSSIYRIGKVDKNE